MIGPATPRVASLAQPLREQGDEINLSLSNARNNKTTYSRQAQTVHDAQYSKELCLSEQYIHPRTRLKE
jgi:hypothetical protein